MFLHYSGKRSVGAVSDREPIMQPPQSHCRSARAQMCLVSFTNRLNMFLARKKIFPLCMNTETARGTDSKFNQIH